MAFWKLNFEDVDEYKQKIFDQGVELALLQKDFNKLKNDGWLNPFNWPSYNGSFDDVGSLDVPANGMVIINDRNIRQQALKLKGRNVKETADNIEKWIHNNIFYTPDWKNIIFNGQVEIFVPSNITFASRQDDCEGYATLFQSMMHICGYKEECITCIAKDVDHLVVWVDGTKIGHGWNKVNINGTWVDYDANAGPQKSKCVYPSMQDLSYFFNYYGVYKLG